MLVVLRVVVRERVAVCDCCCCLFVLLLCVIVNGVCLLLYVFAAVCVRRCV